MTNIPTADSVEEDKEKFLHFLHQVVQHTPLKLSETSGTEYDKGYIFYQDMVLRDVEELETTMWEWHKNTITKDRQAHKQALLDRVEGMKQIEKAINGEYIEIETDVNFALDDITDIINEVYKD